MVFGASRDRHSRDVERHCSHASAPPGSTRHVGSRRCGPRPDRLFRGGRDRGVRLAFRFRGDPLQWQGRGYKTMDAGRGLRSEEHTSELQSLMRISYAVFCLKKKKITRDTKQHTFKIK